MSEGTAAGRTPRWRAVLDRVTGRPSAAAGGPVTCIAPHVSLRLAPDGRVEPCGASTGYSFGSITESSLREIWEGAQLTRLRAALDAGDYSHGCADCAEAADLGLRSVSHAATYDRFWPVDSTWPRRMEFALSNTCNLQCVQCSGELSSAIRAQREHLPPLRSPYGEEFFAEIGEFLPHLEFAGFIGGEPFLMREVRRVWDMLIEADLHPNVHVTTNGTQWNDRVEHYLHALRMDVAVSIDAVEPATQAQLRVGSDLDEVRANRDRFIAATRSYGGDFTLNHCVMPQNWREFMPFLLDADELDVPVYVARVLHPPKYSPFSLPVNELRAMVDGLHAAGAVDADHLGRNRRIWDDTVGELEAHLATLEGMSVPVGLPARPPSADVAEEVDALAAELATAAGLPPAHLVLARNHVATIDSPDWSSYLGLEACQGVHGDAVLPVIEEHLGTTLDLTLGTDEQGRQRHRCRFVVEGHPRQLEIAVIVSGEDRTGRSDILIAPVG